MKRLLTLLVLFAVVTATAGEKSVALERDFGTLRGSLLTPDKGTETVALIIAGSGPTDRNGNNPAGLRTNSYLYLAQALENAGIASLRYDKRGIGASISDEPGGQREEDLTLEAYIGDAAAWVDYLKEQGFRRIVLAGHSEGSSIALSAAQDNPAVSAVVSISGAGFPLDEILRLQLANQLAQNDMALLFQAEGIIASLKAGKRIDYIPKSLEGLFHPSVQPFLISVFRSNPCELIRALQIPVLIIGGDNDLQVTPDNAEALAKAQPRARKVIVKGMTHPLKLSEGKTPTEQIGAYYDSTLPLAPGFTTAVVDFIRTL